MQDEHRFESDIHALAWPSVWAIAATGMIISMVGNHSLNRLDEWGYALLGAATGCLVATWTLTGTWISLADRPRCQTAGFHHSTKQLAKQLTMAAPCLATALALISVVWLRQNTASKLLITQPLLTSVIAFVGPLIVWQWTHRRIHRDGIHPRHSQSIRQILGIVLTMALAIGTIRTSQRWFGINEVTTAIIVSISFNWVLMLGVLLGKRPWVLLPLIGLVFAQWIAVSTMFDLQTQKNGDELTFLAAMLFCSFGFSLLFLLQIRASGYRWLDAPVEAKPDRNN